MPAPEAAIASTSNSCEAPILGEDVSGCGCEEVEGEVWTFDRNSINAGFSSPLCFKIGGSFVEFYMVDN